MINEKPHEDLFWGFFHGGPFCLARLADYGKIASLQLMKSGTVA